MCGVCAHAPCVSVHLLLQRACHTATLSYCTGNVYTSLTGFCFENGAGNVQVSQQGVLSLACARVTLVQLMATGGLLAERGFKFWDFGMEMPYVTPNVYTGFVYQMTPRATATKSPSAPPPSPARNSSRVSTSRANAPPLPPCRRSCGSLRPNPSRARWCVTRASCSRWMRVCLLRR